MIEVIVFPLVVLLIGAAAIIGYSAFEVALEIYEEKH